jgi:glycosyltransferase involved in cell wall biosynthesis
VVWSVGLDITKDSFIHKVLTPILIDAVIVPSKSLKKQITRLGYIDPEICSVIPIGIGETKYTVSTENRTRLKNKYGLPDKAIVAVTSGRFVDQKGHKYLIEAAPAIIAEHPDLYFLWLGAGPLENILKEEIKTRNIEKHFVFAGMLDNVESELAGADLMIHPSIEEPYGIAVLEGMRAGLAVAASRVGGIPEVVRENETAILFEPENPDDLAQKVIALLDNPDAPGLLGTSGRLRWKKHLNLETMIERIESRLESVLNAERDNADT